MKPIYILFAVLLIALATSTDARRKKHKSSDSTPSTKTKTKTKWSSSTDNGPNGAIVATEEHGYYVKRTYLPANSSAMRQSPPYLAIPIAWFSCAEGKTPADCHQSNTAAIAGNSNALSNDGFLCDDDCTEPYAPICGRTSSEIAVFYSQCKLNVAKCRTHGMWQDLSYTECQQMYPKETAYTDKKFRASPFFREQPIAEKPEEQPQKQELTTTGDTEQQVPQEAEKLVGKVPISNAAAFNEVNDKLQANEKMPMQPGMKVVQSDNAPKASIMIN